MPNQSKSQIFNNSEKDFERVYEIAVEYNNVNSDSVFKYADLAYNIAETLNRPPLSMKALLLEVEVYIMEGEFGLAYNICLKAKKIAQANRLEQYEALVNINLGNVYRCIGLQEEAISLFLDVLGTTEPQTYSTFLADLYYYLGLSYYQMNEYERCQQYIVHSLHISEINYSASRIVNCYIQLSNISNILDTIQLYFKLAEIVIVNNPKLQFEKVVLRNNQALINKAIGNFAVAKTQYIEAINISKVNGYTEHLANLYNNFAYLLMAEQKYDSARLMLDQALEAALEVESPDLEASINDSYSDYFKKIGEYDQALAYKSISIEKRNVFRQQQRVQESLFLSVVFETEQKEKEIIVQKNQINRSRSMLLGAAALILFISVVVIYFWQKSKLRKARLISMEKGKSLEVANAVIEGQDLERKRLAMDLHDGMGAQLGSLKFQLDTYLEHNENYQEVIKSVDDIGRNIREISHRMSPARLEELGLKQSLEVLIGSLNISDKLNIEFISDFTNRLDEKQEINLYYLVYELINNAVKHAHASNIVVQLLKHDNDLSLSVEDDGIGMHPEKMTSGHGLNNIKRRVQFLEGKMDIDSSPQSGTVFMIEIPIRT